MAAIGAGWAETAWIQASWAAGAWADAGPLMRKFITIIAAAEVAVQPGSAEVTVQQSAVVKTGFVGV